MRRLIVTNVGVLIDGREEIEYLESARATLLDLPVCLTPQCRLQTPREPSLRMLHHRDCQTW
jgi:hypothetical protein